MALSVSPIFRPCWQAQHLEVAGQNTGPIVLVQLTEAHDSYDPGRTYTLAAKVMKVYCLGCFYYQVEKI